MTKKGQREPELAEAAPGDGTGGDDRHRHVVRPGGHARGHVATRELGGEAGAEQGADAEVPGEHHQRQGEGRR